MEELKIDNFNRYTIDRNGKVTTKRYTIVKKNGHKYTQREQEIQSSINPVSNRKQISLKDDNGDRYTFPLHRLIAITFVANPDNKPDVNHINGDKHDNRPENLEWVTVKENAIHAERLNLRNHPIGLDHSGTRIRPEYVPVIKHLISIGDRSLSSIARMFGVSPTPIYEIRDNKHWTQKAV